MKLAEIEKIVNKYIVLKNTTKRNFKLNYILIFIRILLKIRILV